MLRIIFMFILMFSLQSITVSDANATKCNNHHHKMIVRENMHPCVTSCKKCQECKKHCHNTNHRHHVDRNHNDYYYDKHQVCCL